MYVTRWLLNASDLLFLRPWPPFLVIFSKSDPLELQTKAYVFASQKQPRRQVARLTGQDAVCVKVWKQDVVAIQVSQYASILLCFPLLLYLPELHVEALSHLMEVHIPVKA